MPATMQYILTAVSPICLAGWGRLTRRQTTQAMHRGGPYNYHLRWSVTFARHFAHNTNVSIIVILEIEYLTFCP